MRAFILGLCVLGACSADPGASSGGMGGQYTVTLTVTNVPPSTGVVRAAIFNAPDQFPDGENVGTANSSVPDSGEVDLVFENLKNGLYAISLYHDANENGTFDQTGIGLPQEGYGFSNNAKPGLSAPSFDIAKFEVEGDTSLTVKLITD